MGTEIQHKLLPFDVVLKAPQRLYFNFSNISLQVIWLRNSHDETLSIRINDMNSGITLITTKIILNGVFLVKDVNLNPLFVLFVNNDNIDKPEVWIMSEVDFIMSGFGE